MVNKKYFYLTVTASILGFMLAVQFQSVSEPDVRDSRDIWELREDLMAEKELQSKLYREIQENEDKLSKYENERQSSKGQLLRETLEELKVEAGLTDIEGPGIILTLKPIFHEFESDPSLAPVSPSLLQRLMNELNMYGAQHISIGGHRVINTTVIRQINDVTKLNGHSLDRFPIEIRVIVESPENAEKLYDRMKVSKVTDDFFIDNLVVELEYPNENIVVPAYQDSIRVRYMEPVEMDMGGDE